ncbi:MAG: hypothetical protein AAF669_08265 [Pseudomonadota bacterium]
MNMQLNQVQQTKHTFKTHIGQLKQTGIDFLGYCTSAASQGLNVAAKTWNNHLAKCAQLYEQHASPKAVAAYVHRWLIWLRSSVDIDLSTVLTRQNNTLAGDALLYTCDGCQLR